MKRFTSICRFVLVLSSILFANPALAELVNITLLQLNDVYEITPVSGGKEGGIARVATILRQLEQQNPRTYAILSGDLLSPSALGTVKIDGEPLAGEQMVKVLNAMGLDYATFGNHEFDLKENQLLKRLRESEFKWISSNVLRENVKQSPQPFPEVLPYEILTVKGNEGTPVRIGIIGLTLPANKVDYVSYTNFIQAAQEQVKQLKDQVDIIVAMTHLSLEEDIQLAQKIPEIDLILGGHEHENMQVWRGNDFTPIYKADANGRTVYIHQLYYDTDKHKLLIDSQLKRVTENITDDPATQQIVNQWVKKGFDGFRKQGFDPEKVVANTKISLDGSESSVRNRSTELTSLIASAMLEGIQGGELAIYNSGSIRIDDVLPPGDITQYDILRILPFEGHILEVEIKGSLLERVLNQGLANRGTGGYLQTTDNVKFQEDTNTWLIDGQPLESNKMYRAAINDFLLSGKENNLDFLVLNNPDVKLIEKKGDMRLAVIKKLSTFKPM